VSKIAGNILGLLTLASFAAVVVGTIQGFSEGFWPLAYAGLIIMPGIPWAHTPGKKWLKATFLALVGFIVGGIAGGFVGYKLSPQEPDSMIELAYGFIGFGVGGLLLAFLGVRWTIRFHRRYARPRPSTVASGFKVAEGRGH
jgi:hypothetical protein